MVSHHDDWDVKASTNVSVVISGLEVGRTFRVRRFLVDADTSNAHTRWQQLGCPQDPTDAEYAAMQRAGELILVEDYITECWDGNAGLVATLNAHAVTLFELSPLALGI